MSKRTRNRSLPLKKSKSHKQNKLNPKSWFSHLSIKAAIPMQYSSTLEMARPLTSIKLKIASVCWSMAVSGSVTTRDRFKLRRGTTDTSGILKLMLLVMVSWLKV